MVFSMIIIPLIIGALAVVITLCYASVLHIKYRWAPSITWCFDAFIIGLTAAGVAILFFNEGITLLAGYLGMLSIILFLAYTTGVCKEKNDG